MRGYTSRAEIENYLLIDIDASFHAQVDRWIEDAEAYIENVTGRIFIADDEATDKVYDGDNTSILLIDDCVEIESVSIDDEDPLSYGDSGVDDDFYVYPVNILPKTKLKRASGYWGRGNQNITVTAKWGYSVEVPADIRNVATNIVAGIINTAWNMGAGEDQENEVQSMSIGRYSVTYKQGSTQAKDFQKMTSIFDHYKKYML